MNSTNRFRFGLTYALVFASGAAALIYEVTWQRYLTLLVGVQAKATAIVLAVFLGGISAGYYGFGRLTARRKFNLAAWYVGLESALAIWGVLFPFWYRVAHAGSAALFRWFGVTSSFVDLLIAVALMAVPCFLMGGTLPLLTQILGERHPDASQTHARIYGWNTLGGALGCALCGYFLIPSTGLIGASLIAAAINVFVAISSGVLFFRWQARSVEIAKKRITNDLPKSDLNRKQFAAVLTVAFVSGFVLVTLQTVLMRLYRLAVGSTDDAFTLIVSIVIASLGAGSLAIKRFERVSPAHLVVTLGISGILLTLVHTIGDVWPYAAHVVRVLLRDSDESFILYQLLLTFQAGAFLLVPLAFAGAVLPLCFHLVKEDNSSLGLKVGQIYSVNTVGCVSGALLGGYFLLHWLDLDTLFKACLALWFASAGYFVWRFDYLRTVKAQGLAAASFTTVFVVLMVLPSYQKERFLQPFRHPRPISSSFNGPDAFGRQISNFTSLRYWKDGPNTSVGITANSKDGIEISRSLFVSGKSDGSTKGDLFTVSMLGHIPAIFSPNINRACVIGFGTGITAGVLAQYGDNRKVDILEISGTVISQAAAFDAYNSNVSSNPKVKIHEVDAFRFFSAKQEPYDIIVSEPSNPWVSGVENLYSDEFYTAAIRNLNPTGLFVQWIHTYSFSNDLLTSVLRTMSRSFPYVSIYELKEGDVALVGAFRRLSPEDLHAGARRIESDSPVKQSLFSLGIKTPLAIAALELMTPEMVRALVGPGPVQTLESPFLSREAGRAFFRDEKADIPRLRRAIKGHLQMLEFSMLAQATARKGIDEPTSKLFHETFCDFLVSRSANLCEELLNWEVATRGTILDLGKYSDFVPTRELSGLSAMTPSARGVMTEARLQKLHDDFERYKSRASSVNYRAADGFLKDIQQCRARVESNSELYGECVLQEVILLEAYDPKGSGLQHAIRAYLDWFPKLSSKSKNFLKLREARDILSTLNASH